MSFNSSFFLFIDSNSKQNMTVFPDNVPTNFKIHLTEPIQLDNIWKVALTEIHIKEDNRTMYMSGLYVLCDLVDYSIVNGGQRQPILRRLQCNKKGNWIHQYESPNYLSMNKTQIFDIEFFILDSELKTPSFMKKPVSLTLHFPQYPFFL